ncbi:hypothetical protein Sjap_015976 [Stephania japonica]|uniref:Uncharacterized protein n=1 Tax=Stephania japonica TaxID=461633 RepID=A0AAP0IK63_9MAGN
MGLRGGAGGEEDDWDGLLDSGESSEYIFASLCNVRIGSYTCYLPSCILSQEATLFKLATISRGIGSTTMEMARRCGALPRELGSALPILCSVLPAPLLVFPAAQHMRFDLDKFMFDDVFGVVEEL